LAMWAPSVSSVPSGETISEQASWRRRQTAAVPKLTGGLFESCPVVLTGAARIARSRQNSQPSSRPRSWAGHSCRPRRQDEAEGIESVDVSGSICRAHSRTKIPQPGTVPWSIRSHPVCDLGVAGCLSYPPRRSDAPTASQPRRYPPRTGIPHLKTYYFIRLQEGRIPEFLGNRSYRIQTVPTP
jgi:hypothetical protein